MKKSFTVIALLLLVAGVSYADFICEAVCETEVSEWRNDRTFSFDVDKFKQECAKRSLEIEEPCTSHHCRCDGLFKADIVSRSYSEDRAKYKLRYSCSPRYYENSGFDNGGSVTKTVVSPSCREVP